MIDWYFSGTSSNRNDPRVSDRLLTALSRSTWTSLIFSNLVYSRIASANFRIWEPGGKTLEVSLDAILNRREEKTLPCGTPTLLLLGWAEWAWKNSWRSVVMKTAKLRSVENILHLISWSKITSGSRALKALLISSANAIVPLIWANHAITSVTQIPTQPMTDLSFLNSNKAFVQCVIYGAPTFRKPPSQNFIRDLIKTWSWVFLHAAIAKLVSSENVLFIELFYCLPTEDKMRQHSLQPVNPAPSLSHETRDY